MMSTKMMSGRWSAIFDNASNPSTAVNTSQPSLANSVSAVRRIVLLSSMTRIFRPARSLFGLAALDTCLPPPWDLSGPFTQPPGSTRLLTYRPRAFHRRSHDRKGRSHRASLSPSAGKSGYRSGPRFHETANSRPKKRNGDDRGSARTGRRDGSDRDDQAEEGFDARHAARGAEGRLVHCLLATARPPGPGRRPARGGAAPDGPRRPGQLVHARGRLEPGARAPRRAAHAQGSAVRHGVHLHDLYPRARRESRPARREQAVEPAGHQRKGLHVVVPAVHAADPRDAVAKRAAVVPRRASPDRAQAVRRHGRPLDLRRDRGRPQRDRDQRDEPDGNT